MVERDEATAGGVRAIVVAGVSGSGKTTVGRALAARLGWTFLEGDAYHPPRNRAALRAGRPLTDADRAPWLAALRRALDAELAAGRGAVLACSALKAAYRRELGADRPEVRLVMLASEPDRIAARLAARRGHFAHPGLLDSQFADLEAPGPGEAALVLPADEPPDALVARIVDRLAPTRGGPGA